MLIYITGPSGCGKSRLVLAMMEENGYNQNIAWMPQNPVWFKGTLLENLCPTEMRSLDDVRSALRLVNLEHFTLRLGEQVLEYANNFSGGEKRRLAIARIILLNRPVWILDEPYAGLDKANIKNIENLLEKEGQNRNILCITHHFF